jgi:hypothetical protein
MGTEKNWEKKAEKNIKYKIETPKKKKKNGNQRDG